MFKKTMSWILVCTLLLTLIPAAVLAAGSGSTGTYYSYADIVKRTYDMSHLATEPKPGEGGKQITSTDPSSRYNEETGLYENWSANLDNSGYVRYEDGYRVLADLEGPGYVSRIWMPTKWTGTMQIIIDGEMLYSGSMLDFLWGSYFSEFEEFSFQTNAHESEQFPDGYLGGIDLFVPITYNESCVIRIDCKENSSWYYNISYYELEDGATVESFTWPMSAENRAALEKANEILADTSVPSGNVNYEKIVTAGETVTLFESVVPGAVSATTLKLNIPKSEFDDKSSLASWYINMYWDGAADPAVSMSVADFYGSHYGIDAFDNAAYGVSEDGTLYSTWYMPFNAAKITLTNASDSACNVQATFATETLTDAQANELMRFHANWQRSYPRTDDRYPEANLLRIEGEGRYVGTSLHVYQIVDGIWWGEGDEKFYIDGEKYPTWFGTGSEDYFCYAWCASDIFVYPYCGQPHNDGFHATGDAQVQGHGDKVNYRLHVSESIVFHSSFDANIEKYFDDTMDQYAATTFFYLTKETTSNHVAQAPALEDRLFNNDMLNGETLLYPGAYLISRLIYNSSSVKPVLQGMGDFANEQYQWYGGVQLYWQNTYSGKYLEFELNIPETGEYSIELSKTNAFDYGQFTFYLDDKVIGTMDACGSGVTKSKTTLSTQTVTKGEHILKIACTGTSGGGYMLGLDCIEFVPVKQEDAPVEVITQFIGWDTLNSGLGEYTVSAPPTGQGLDAFVTTKNQWYNNSHLVWNAGENGSVDFNIFVNESGTYSMDIGHTMAADFGRFQVSIDGVPVGPIIDGYMPGAVWHNERTAYNLELTSGNHVVTITSVGKNAAAVGYLIGIDYLELNTQTTVGAFYDGTADLLSTAMKDYTGNAPYWQDLGWVATEVWQRNGHLCYNSGAATGEMNFTIELPADAVYDITTGFTQAGDFGQFELWIDGNKVSDIHDGFGSLGQTSQTTQGVSLTAGTHTLAVKLVGKNDSASGYLVGIDYIQFLAAVNADAPAPTIDIKYSGSAGLLAVLKDYTSAEPPHDQGIGGLTDTTDDGSHMFWRAAAGDEANFEIKIDVAGDYDITLAHTCAGDFGQFDVYIDGVRIAEAIDGFNAGVVVKQALIKKVALTSGTHILTIKSVGKNDSSGGTFIGIDYITFSTKIQSADEDEIVDNSGLFEAEKKAAKEELEAYAEAAYQTADQFQTPRIRRALTAAKVALCQAATVEEINKLLADTKAEIDTILATVFEEELDVNYDPEANLEVYYRGSADLLEILSDYSTQEAPHDQALGLPVLDDGAHLFWRSGVGDTMSFKVKIPVDGIYDLEMPYTCYVDFGMFEVYLDDVKLGDVYDAYNADAIITRPVTVAGLNLTAGEHTLTIKCVGKNDSSSGTVLGIDYVRFLGEGSVTELDAYKNAAKTYLDSYKKSIDYSAEQWNAVLAEIARQKDLIDACGSVDAVVEAWKNAKAALDAVPSGLIDYDTLDFSDTLTPGDYGWETDGGNYTNWQVAPGNEYFDEVFFVEYNGTNSKRIWKDIIEDPDNFTISLTVKVENWRAEIELMGVHIELNCEHGNGNQIFDRESWSWFDAKDQICEVTISRENGGDLVFTLKGQGNSTPVTITKAVVDGSNQNLYLGVIDATGSAFFHDIVPAEVDNGEDPGENPENPENPVDPENPDTGDTVQMLAALLLISAMSAVTLINQKSLFK